MSKFAKTHQYITYELDLARSSTRVHAPPGGASSISFGSPSTPNEMEQPPQKKKPEEQFQASNTNLGVSPQVRRKSAHAMMSGSGVANIFGDDHTAPTSPGKGVRQAPGAALKSSFSLG